MINEKWLLLKIRWLEGVQAYVDQMTLAQGGCRRCRAGTQRLNDILTRHFDMKMRGFQGLNNSRSKWLERGRREYGAEMTLSQGGWMGWQASIRGINDTR
ncbi:hypothetical protein T4B_3713 [Trichinella pseudospiralis]|uniref:Uncharacterized protein n=1 Tax=Trichinella pseudospiralis TaxID=6337 RepID=A0A0V1GSC1_TRIPS|nr:hypothetical protein T4A_6011 [Trichinella pseudospiralis]KRY64895.1 hypothetical protein T4A_6308 [Trichinella pseudospiralis]KRZ00883.1 hypothetical protein T4B_3713 [Trichinella pseudospiralis]